MRRHDKSKGSAQKIIWKSVMIVAMLFSQASYEALEAGFGVLSGST